MRAIAVVAALFASAPAALADTLLVGNKAEHTVSFIDLETGEEVARRETGRAPHEIAVSPDGKTAVVVSYAESGYAGNTLHVFDIPSAEKTGVIDLGEATRPHGLKWIPGTSRVIVTTEGSREVLIADAAGLRIVERVSSDAFGTHMVALSPDGKRAYASNIGSGSFGVYSVDPLKRLRDVEAGAGSEAIAVSPDGKEIWVGSNGLKSVMIFDAKSFRKKAEIDTGGVPIRVEISPDGGFAAVSEADMHRVAIFDAASRKPVAVVDLAAAGLTVPVTLLFSPEGDRLYAAATSHATVAEISTADWSIVRKLKAGAGSDGLGLTAASVETEGD